MLIVKRRTFGVVVGETFFAPAISTGLPQISDCDLVSFIHAKESALGARVGYTLQIDLLHDEDQILSEMPKTTRYKIRRAERQDGLRVSHITRPAYEDVLEFSEAYDALATRKPLPTHRLSRLMSFNGVGALVLTKAVAEGGNVLCWHCYIVDGERAWMLYSVSSQYDLADSSDRNDVGRANRYLHWCDIRQFKAAGLAIYDFGGLSGPPGRGTLPGIDDFKLGFGGTVVAEYNQRLGRTLVGRVAAATWPARDGLTKWAREHVRSGSPRLSISTGEQP